MVIVHFLVLNIVLFVVILVVGLGIIEDLFFLFVGMLLVSRVLTLKLFREVLNILDDLYLFLSHDFILAEFLFHLELLEFLLDFRVWGRVANTDFFLFSLHFSALEIGKYLSISHLVDAFSLSKS